MRVEAVRLEGRELILTLPGPGQEARRFAYMFKPGNYEIKKTTVKRSLTANAYLWTLCDKIARAVGDTKEEVYRDAIRHKGSFFQQDIKAADIERYRKAWEAQGLGNQVEIVGTAGDTATVNAYYGSHLYDQQEMSAVVDYVVQTARDMDIETMPEEELRSLLSSWR